MEGDNLKKSKLKKKLGEIPKDPQDTQEKSLEIGNVKIALNEVLEGYLDSMKNEIEEKILFKLSQKAIGIFAIIIAFIVGMFITFLGLHNYNLTSQYANINIINNLKNDLNECKLFKEIKVIENKEIGKFKEHSSNQPLSR